MMRRMRLSDMEQEVVLWRPQSAGGRRLAKCAMLLGLMLVAQVRWTAAENQSDAGSTTPRSALVVAQAEQLGPVTQEAVDHLSTAAPAASQHQQASINQHQQQQQQQPQQTEQKQPPQTSESSSDQKEAQLGVSSGATAGHGSPNKLDSDKQPPAKSVALDQQPASTKKSRKSKQQKQEAATLKQQVEDESIQRSSTNQVASYADSPTASSTMASARWQMLDHQTPPPPPPLPLQPANQSPALDQRKHRQQPEPHSQRPGNGNKWTHFGARLKPLAAGSPMTPEAGQQADHAGSASTNPRSHSAAHYVPHASTQSASYQRHRQAMPASTSGEPESASESPESAPSSDAADQDEQSDSEALLYKMMQQPGNMLDQEDQDESQDPQAAPGPDKRGPVANNRRHAHSDRVMKLLKSYSHIHQVDDTDDQIRGSPHKPAARSQQQLRRGPSAGQLSSSGHDDGSWRGGDWKQQQQAIVANRQHRNRQPLERNSYSENSLPEVDSDDGSYHASQDEAPQQPAASGDQAASSPEEEFECPNNGIFADEPSGCQYYHVCQSGAQVQQRFQCPLGTLFNNLILTCDFAHNVHCGKNQSLKQRPALPEHPSYQPVWQEGGRGQAAKPVARVAQPRALKIGQAAPSARRYQQVQPVAAPVANEIDGSDDDGSEDADDEMPSSPAKPPQAPQINNQIRRHQMSPQIQYNKRVSEPQQSYMNRQVEFDGASVTTPVFASRDESASLPNVLEPPMHPSTPNAIMDNNSFNLVINHLTTTSQNKQPHTPIVRPMYQQQQQQQQPQHQLQQQYQRVQAANNALQLVRAPQDSTQYQREPKYAGSVQQPRQQVAPSNTRRPGTALHQTPPIQSQRQSPQLNPSSTGARFSAPQSDNRNARQYQQHLVASSGRQEPSLIDLTNDMRQQVSSAAINDGLVLLVRHDTAPAPVFKAARHAPNTMQPTPASATGGGGRALAVDPRVIRPDSALDSHLFPNVQSALVPGKAAQTSQRMVAAHLPRVEPPKPQHQQFSAMRPNQYTAASNQVSQIAAAPSVSPAPETKKVTSHQRVRRAKKVRQLDTSQQQSGSSRLNTPKPIAISPTANNTTTPTTTNNSSTLATPLPQSSSTTSTTKPDTTSFMPIQKRLNKTLASPKDNKLSSISSKNPN